MITFISAASCIIEFYCNRFRGKNKGIQAKGRKVKNPYIRGLLPECNLRLSDFVGTHSIYRLTSPELRWCIKDARDNKNVVPLGKLEYSG